MNHHTEQLLKSAAKNTIPLQQSDELSELFSQIELDELDELPEECLDVLSKVLSLALQLDK